MSKVFMCVNVSMAPSYKAMISIEKMRARAIHDGINTAIYYTNGTTQGYLDMSRFCHMFLETDATHLMFCADDVIFPVDTVPKLIVADKDIICGIYRTRNPNSQTIACYVREPDKFNDYLNAAAIVESDYCSHHSMLIKRHVIEQMIPKYPELVYQDYSYDKQICALFMPEIKDNKIQLDDWVFAERARKIGFECWLHFGVRLKHKALEMWLGVGNDEEVEVEE